jgi:hypothetical protein
MPLQRATRSEAVRPEARYTGSLSQVGTSPGGARCTAAVSQPGVLQWSIPSAGVVQKFGKCFTAGPIPANRQHSIVKEQLGLVQCCAKNPINTRSKMPIYRTGTKGEKAVGQRPNLLILPMAEARGFTEILVNSSCRAFLHRTFRFSITA